MFAQEFTVDYNIEEFSLPDESGNDVAGAFTNPRATISITGFVNTGSSFSSTLGAALTIANSIDASSFVSGAADDSAGETITTSVKRGYGNKSFKSFDIGAVFAPNMGAVQP